jgi:hypothetical protein
MSGDETTGGHNGGSETGGNYAKGGWIAPGSVAVSDQAKPELVWTVAQADRALAWIKAHYGKPEFRCPEQLDQD